MRAADTAAVQARRTASLWGTSGRVSGLQGEIVDLQYLFLTTMIQTYFTFLYETNPRGSTTIRNTVLRKSSAMRPGSEASFYFVAL